MDYKSMRLNKHNGSYILNCKLRAKDFLHRLHRFLMTKEMSNNGKMLK